MQSLNIAGQTVKHWRLPLRDDATYEGEETLLLQMMDPVSAVLEFPEVAMVTIMDLEDGRSLRSQ